MIRLHHVPLARSFRVLWLLEELGLDHEVVNYSIRDGSLRSPEFLALSPAGRVPVLEHHGAVWFESGAIVQMLCETYPDAGLMPGPGHPERPDRLRAVLAALRAEVAPLGADRFLAPDLERAAGMIRSGALIRAAGIEGVRP